MSTLSSTSDEPLGLLGTPGGVEVHLLRTTKFKTVHLHWVVEAPLDEGRTARAILPDLLTRGTARYPELSALSARCEELYNTDLIASVTAHGSRQVLRFGVETIADRFASDGSVYQRVVELLASVLHEPPLVDGAFRADHLEQERTNLARAIESLADDKPLYAYRRMVETMHAGSPLALHSWGEAEQARALGEPDVRAAWEHVRDEAPARLLIVGDVSPEQALETASRLSGVATRAAPAAPTPIPKTTVESVRDVEDVQRLAQSRLAMGFRLPVDLLPGPASSLMSIVFGGGSHSRLFKRVREAESLAYGCSASTIMDSGTLIVQAGVDGEHVPRVQEIVVEELQRLARDGVDAEEFDLSVRAQRRRLIGLADAAAGQLGFRLAGLMTGRVHEPAQALADLEALTPAHVSAVAEGCELDTVYVLRGEPS